MTFYLYFTTKSYLFSLFQHLLTRFDTFSVIKKCWALPGPLPQTRAPGQRTPLTPLIGPELSAGHLLIHECCIISERLPWNTQWWSSEKDTDRLHFGCELLEKTENNFLKKKYSSDMFPTWCEEIVECVDNGLWLKCYFMANYFERYT